MKTFPRKGRAQGPGGKLCGLQFLTTSIKSNTKKINTNQLVKSIHAKIFWKIMIKIFQKPLCNIPLSFWEQAGGGSEVIWGRGGGGRVQKPNGLLHNTDKWGFSVFLVVSSNWTLTFLQRMFMKKMQSIICFNEVRFWKTKGGKEVLIWRVNAIHRPNEIFG